MWDRSYKAAHEKFGVGIEPLEAQENVVLVDASSVSIGLLEDQRIESRIDSNENCFCQKGLQRRMGLAYDFFWRATQTQSHSYYLKHQWVSRQRGDLSVLPTSTTTPLNGGTTLHHLWSCCVLDQTVLVKVSCAIAHKIMYDRWSCWIR